MRGGLHIRESRVRVFPSRFLPPWAVRRIRRLYVALTAVSILLLSASASTVALWIAVDVARDERTALAVKLAASEAEERRAASRAAEWEAAERFARVELERAEAQAATLRGVASDLGRCEAAAGACEDWRRENEGEAARLRDRVEVLTHQVELRTRELCEARRQVAGRPPGECLPLAKSF